MAEMVDTETITLVPVHLRLPSGEPVAIAARLADLWEKQGMVERVRGKQIAIGVGSRGVASIDEIAREVVSLIKASGGEPFIVPAMGSHGGATPEGQIEVLRGLSVTEESVGCPIRATMDTVVLGETANGIPVHFDRNAAEADGVIVINRVKMHTDYHGPYESGMMKMIAIGLGKESGALAIHRFGTTGLRDYMPEVARVTLESGKILGGIGTVEDGSHACVELDLLLADEVESGERRLLDRARDLMPMLPIKDMDVLIIDEMGKDISGTGMDSNVLGRMRIDGEPEPDFPNVGLVVILDLTEPSHGNATGIGLADMTVKRLMDKIDFLQMTPNAYTSGFLRRGNVPLVFQNDREAIDAAIRHESRVPKFDNGVRIVRIKNTLELEHIQVSPNLLDEIQDHVISAGEFSPMLFDDDGHLVDL